MIALLSSRRKFFPARHDFRDAKVPQIVEGAHPSSLTQFRIIPALAFAK